MVGSNMPPLFAKATRRGKQHAAESNTPPENLGVNGRAEKQQVACELKL